MTSISDPSPAYTAMQAKRDLTETLMGGTAAMRAAARERRYMWPGPGEMRDVNVGTETITAYEMRIRESVLENYWLEGVEGAAARPFTRAWKLDGWDSVLVDLLANVDRTGRSWRRFFFDSFRHAEAHGLDAVLVTAPTGGGAPYWVGIRGSDILDAVHDDSEEPRLEILRIRQTQTTRDASRRWRPVAELPELIGVYYAGALDAKPGSDDAKVHKETYDPEVSDSEPIETVVIEPARGELREIPVTPVYGGRTGFFEADPPYYDQAELQAAHWRKLSRADWRAKIIAIPLLFQSGVDFDSDNPRGGADMEEQGRIWATEPAADAKMVETSGAALGALAEDLERVKKSIREGTMQASLSRPAGDATAFEIGVSDIRANVRIEADTLFLEGSVQRTVGLTATMLGLSKAGKVSVPHDFGMATSGTTEKVQLYLGGKFSPEGFWPEYKLAGQVSDGFDVEEEIARVRGLEPPDDPMAETEGDLAP